jgi:hypothetical protein
VRSPTQGAELRKALMADGVFWAVVKLTQGFAGQCPKTCSMQRFLFRCSGVAHRSGSCVFADAASSSPRPDAGLRPRSVPRGNLVPAALFADRFTITARLLHNTAIDAACCEEAAKRPCVELMGFFASQVTAGGNSARACTHCTHRFFVASSLLSRTRTGSDTRTRRVLVASAPAA